MEVVEYLFETWWGMNMWGRIVTFLMISALVAASRKTIVTRKDNS